MVARSPVITPLAQFGISIPHRLCSSTCSAAGVRMQGDSAAFIQDHTFKRSTCCLRNLGQSSRSRTQQPHQLSHPLSGQCPRMTHLMPGVLDAPIEQVSDLYNIVISVLVLTTILIVRWLSGPRSNSDDHLVGHYMLP